MSDPKHEFVALSRSQSFVQQAAIRDVLTEAGIPFLELDDLGPTAWMLSVNTPMVYVEFRCPADRVREAKDILCSNGIVCDVSERLLRRTLEEVVIPLLTAPTRDLERLLYLAGINNKETVAAIYEETRKLGGGVGLLRDLFFAMVQRGEGNLALLARTVSQEVDGTFGERFLAEMATGDKDARSRLLDVVPTFRSNPWALRALAAGLRDQDPDVRDAASEALFAVHQTDHGYDPQAPAADREAAVARFLEAVHLA